MMDVLVEMAPGSGWLARENRRIVFLPSDESVDVAHDVIEPLLLPRDLDESFAIFAEWVSSGRPLPPMLLIGLEPSVRVACTNFAAIDVTDQNGSQHRVELPTTHETVHLGEISTLTAGDTTQEASGMFVEGVVRAGGIQLHMHRGWGTDGPEHTAAHQPISRLAIEVAGVEVVVGTGLVLGRWPYSHPDFDDSLEAVIVSDPAVSRLHAELRPTPDATLLVDRGSHNGTWVVHPDEGRTTRLDANQSLVIGPGDEIRLGDNTIPVRRASHSF